MAVEENLNKSMYKLLILMLKYIPMLISLVYVLNTALSYFYIDIPVLSNLAGMSILPWIFMYLSATVADVYVAINSQYHDYAELFKNWFGDGIEQKIVESAIVFWFKDADCKAENKVVEYLGEY
jgi:hypothetical protein